MFDHLNLAHALGIQGYVHGNEFRAKCPLHQDRNPSFSLNIPAGVWICHAGCGKGDFIRLVELVMGCSPQEAHDWIRNNGHSASVDMLSKDLAVALGQIPPEEVALAPSSDWFERFSQLSNNVMPMWFLERGFTWGTVNKWNLRYDPIEEAVIIPVMWDNQLLGTITRNTSKFLPKYQNSDGLPKSEILFGEISKAVNEIIIVEGVLDALWLWQLGYNAVSILGSSISAKQVEIVRRYRFGEVIMCLDNDEAGVKGTEAAVKLFVNSGWLLPQIKVIEFPGWNKNDPGYRKDANDCDAEQFATLYANRRSAIYGV